MDFKREKSHKSRTAMELVLTQEEKTKYAKLYDFLLQDSDDDARTDDGAFKIKLKTQSLKNFRSAGDDFMERAPYNNCEQNIEVLKK